MKHDHQLTYIDMHPQSVQPRRQWLQDICAALAIFAAIGILLAWRG